MDSHRIGSVGDVMRGNCAAGISLLDCSIVYAGSRRDCGRSSVAENCGVLPIVRWIASGRDGGAQRRGGYSDSYVVSLHGVLGNWASFRLVALLQESSQ